MKLFRLTASFLTPVECEANVAAKNENDAIEKGKELFKHHKEVSIVSVLEVEQPELPFDLSEVDFTKSEVV